MTMDLHWLVQEGYVTEFADGRLFTPPPMAEARVKAAESGEVEEHDPENFPEAPVRPGPGPTPAARNPLLRPLKRPKRPRRNRVPQPRKLQGPRRRSVRGTRGSPRGDILRVTVLAGSMSDSSQPALSFVIPLYNSAETIGPLVRDIEALYRRGHEVVLVNDGSHDSTLDVCQALVRLARVPIAGRIAQPGKKAVMPVARALGCNTQDAQRAPGCGAWIGFRKCAAASAREWIAFRSRLRS